MPKQPAYFDSQAAAAVAVVRPAPRGAGRYRSSGQKSEEAKNRYKGIKNNGNAVFLWRARKHRESPQCEGDRAESYLHGG